MRAIDQHVLPFIEPSSKLKYSEISLSWPLRYYRHIPERLLVPRLSADVAAAAVRNALRKVMLAKHADDAALFRSLCVGAPLLSPEFIDKKTEVHGAVIDKLQDEERRLLLGMAGVFYYLVMYNYFYDIKTGLFFCLRKIVPLCQNCISFTNVSLVGVLSQASDVALVIILMYLTCKTTWRIPSAPMRRMTTALLNQTLPLPRLTYLIIPFMMTNQKCVTGRRHRTVTRTVIPVNTL